jgi:putative membrane protein
MPNRFTEQELERIRQAVAQAEERTSGEIVPYIVAASGTYPIAIWRGAVLLALVALAATLIFFQLHQGWSMSWLYAGWGVALITLMAGSLGALLGAFVPPIKRLLAGKELVQTVHLAAHEAFLQEEVFATRERTGILLYVSLFEHRVEVVGDTGINQRVTVDDWADVIARVQMGVKNGKLTEGIVEALQMCGELLEKSGLTIRPDDVNELPDRLRIRDPKTK